jgi:Tfp pilus assembly protein PilN
MLRTNLSTRPFYNERAVLWGVALAAIAIAALTVFNVTRILSYSREQSRLGADITRDETRARTLATQADRVRATIDQTALERVIKAAREANGVIDERTFSWTELFNHLERTLPPNVMLTMVQPTVSDSGVRVAMTVLGREVEHVDTFIEKLEETGAFSGVLATAEQVTETGMYQVTLTGNYKPSPTPAAAKGAHANGDAAPGEPAAGEPAQDDSEPGSVEPEQKPDADGERKSAPKAAPKTTPSRPTPPRHELPGKPPAGKASAGEAS